VSSGALGENRGVAQLAVVGAVLVHDGEPLDAAFERTGFRDIDDLRVEISVFAGQLLVDDIRDHVRDLANALCLRGEFVRNSGQLGLLEDVPQAKVSPEPAVGLHAERTGDQRLGVEHLPVGEARLIGGGLCRLDERSRIERPERS